MIFFFLFCILYYFSFDFIVFKMKINIIDGNNLSNSVCLNISTTCQHFMFTRSDRYYSDEVQYVSLDSEYPVLTY